MARLSVNGIELEAQVIGTGEPVLLIPNYPSVYAPMLKQSALAGRYRLIDYHRRNTGGSTHDTQPRSLTLDGADARALLSHFGVERAHVVGHSGGGRFAIQFTLDYPDAVHSLALLEPAGIPGPSMAQHMAALALARRALAEGGDAATYLNTFISAAIGPESRRAYDRELPGWFEMVVADLEWEQQHPSPGWQELQLSEELIRRITQPVLAVLGANSPPFLREGHELLLKLLPQAEGFILPGADHALQVMNPRGMAEALAGFFARHPLPVQIP